MTQMKKTALAVLVAAGVFGFGTATAQVSQSEANRLGQDLTPVGAERAGNAEGTIPEWTGGITQPPAGFRVGQFHPDPFADDRPRMQITAQNYREHADQLSEGQKAMFERYPDFRMDVYPTRRSASFPERTYEFTKRHATSCRLVADGEGVADCAEGIPFPIPSNGHEVIWNHKLKYKGVAIARWANQAAVTAGGQFNMVRLREELLGLYYRPGATSESINNILLYFYQEVVSPARLAGQVLLVHETMNSSESPRQAWVYNPGQRRVRRAPNVAYDNPGTASDGLRTNDMTDMFNGAMDRFDWELVGKREMYIPYNAYRAHGPQVTPRQLIQAGHLNPDYLRYELHRVWVVEATLKEGSRHINSRRTFYVDEDSWQIVMIDHYDGAGRLWRLSEAHTINYYEMPTIMPTLEVHYDLRSGRYIVGLVDNDESPFDFSHQTSPENFSPQNLRARGVR